MFERSRFLTTILLLGAAGCTSLDPRVDFDHAQRHVESTVGAVSLYRPEDEQEIDQRVTALVRDGLTVHEAILVCLLNNPGLHAKLLQIGVARADLVQSELISNPSFSFAPRWPDGGGLANLQLGLAPNVAELWQIPFRRQAAVHELDRVILDAAREAGLLAQQAKVAYYRVVQAEGGLELARVNTELTQQLVDLTVSRRDAGAGSDLDVSLARAQHVDAKLLAQNAALDVARARGEFAKHLGLHTQAETVVLLDPQPEPLALGFTSEQILAVARQSRLDWQALDMAVQSAESRVAYERSRLIEVFELGVTAERNAQFDKSRGGGVSVDRSLDISNSGSGGTSVSRTASFSRERREPQNSEWVVGPNIALDVPIFDQNQAQVARAEYMLRQSQKLVEVLIRDVTQDARIVAVKLSTAVDNVRLYRDEILPLREHVLTLSQDGYRTGRTTFLAVLEAQRGLLDSRVGYNKSRQEYVEAVVEIERVAGCPFDRLVQTTIPPAEDKTDASQQNTAGIHESMEADK